LIVTGVVSDVAELGEERERNVTRSEWVLGKREKLVGFPYRLRKVGRVGFKYKLHLGASLTVLDAP